MTKIDKRVLRLKENPRNVDCDELISIVIALGFDLRKRKKQHRVCVHPDLPRVRLVIPEQRPLKVVYVRQILLKNLDVW